MHFKLNDIHKNTEFFLSDVAGYKRFLQIVKSLLGEFKRSKQEYFNDWCETTLANISDDKSNIWFVNFYSFIRLFFFIFTISSCQTIVFFLLLLKFGNKW